jgi:hypothetical protein
VLNIDYISLLKTAKKKKKKKKKKIKERKKGEGFVFF